MPVTDRIRRSGLGGRSVLTGPSQLRPPLSAGAREIGARFGVTDVVDQYELGTAGVGASPGTYAVTLRPVSQNRLTARHRGIGELLVIRQANGINAPTTALSLVARRKPQAAERPISITGIDVNAGDRVWVLVNLIGSSEVRYELELDQTAHTITVSSAPPNRTVAAPTGTTFPVTATTNDGGTLSYQWQVSTNGGTSYGNVSNGGVYSGATTATLSISNSTGFNTYRYRVIISSTGGSAQVTTAHGLLTVT